MYSWLFFLRCPIGVYLTLYGPGERIRTVLFVFQMTVEPKLKKIFAFRLLLIEGEI